jgi:hypothetical protein
LFLGATLARILQRVDAVLLTVESLIVGLHRPADQKLPDDGSHGQPMQNFGDHAITVFAVTQGHDSTLSRSQTHPSPRFQRSFGRIRFVGASN